MSDIVERLRAHSVSHERGGVREHHRMAVQHCHEAADEIERLTKTIDALQIALSDRHPTIDALRKIGGKRGVDEDWQEIPLPTTTGRISDEQ